MKNVFKLGAFMVAIAFFATTAQAQQKFGYMNSSAVLALMPQMKAAESTLEATKTQYQEKGNKMVETLQNDYATAQKEMAEGVLSPQEQEKRGKALQAQEQEIAKFEQEMMTKLQMKEAELLQPILDEVKKAIDEVAAEGGYNFIFNDVPGAGGFILFKDESADVTKEVMKKLGLAIPTDSSN